MFIENPLNNHHSIKAVYDVIVNSDTIPSLNSPDRHFVYDVVDALQEGSKEEEESTRIGCNT